MKIIYKTVVLLMLICLAGLLNAREGDRGQHKSSTALRRHERFRYQQQFQHQNHQIHQEKEDKEKHSEFVKGKSKSLSTDC